MSADDLENSLVLASTTEQELFKARAQFDLVVYYDQGTNDVAHLQSSMAHPLRTLHTALYDFNYTKPLRRPPLLLTGGLNAWVNIFGHMSLKSEEPQGPTPPAIQRRSQQGVRAPTPLLLERRSQNPLPYPTTEISVASRTVAMPTEPGPINIEEEKLWMEQLRKESDYGSVSTVGSDTKRRSTSSTSVTYFSSENTIRSGSTVHPRTVEEYVNFPSLSNDTKLIPTLVQTIPSESPRTTKHDIQHFQLSIDCECEARRKYDNRPSI
jgi:ubiquitin carboxyl-terminal hydrolase 8